MGEIRDQKLSHRLLTGLSLDETIARLAVGSSGKDAAMSRLYMTDALNSVIAQMKDEEGVGLANSYAYSPYGQSVVLGADATGNPIQYTSRENDGTGLLFYRARHYDPLFGERFISEDPIRLQGGVNLFAYVEGNPLDSVDPTGLDRKVVNLGAGWTGGIDLIPQTPGQFEIHVFDNSGREVGMYGSNGWFDKHGHKGRPANCPLSVENQLKGQSIDLLRRANLLPPKGEMNIKGDRWSAGRGAGTGVGVMPGGGGGGGGGGGMGNVRLNPLRIPYN